jgi:hypothetical protein
MLKIWARNIFITLKKNLITGIFMLKIWARNIFITLNRFEETKTRQYYQFNN